MPARVERTHDPAVVRLVPVPPLKVSALTSSRNRRRARRRRRIQIVLDKAATRKSSKKCNPMLESVRLVLQIGGWTLSIAYNAIKMVREFLS